MRAVDIRGGAGPAEALFINDNVPNPTPKPGEVLVKVKAFGLNRMDLSQRLGHYPLPPQAPSILGVEFSGTVHTTTTTTSDDEGFQPGDEVFGLAYGGAYAEYISVSSKMLIHKPHSLSFETAAAIPETWITATQALYTVGGFKRGQSLLMHAGASSVGLAAIQLAAAHGASAVVATASTEEKLAFCRSLGATHALNYRTGDWAEEVVKATGGKGVDLIVDPVGQSHFGADLKCAARDGKIVLLAVMSGSVAKEVDIGPILFKRLRVEGTTLRSRDLEYQRVLRDKVVEEALPGIVDGSFKVPVEKIFDWKDIVEAHKLMESNQTQGKIICVIP